MKGIWKKILIELLKFAADFLGKYYIENIDSKEKEVETIKDEFDKHIEIDSTESVKVLKLASINQDQWDFLKDVSKMIQFASTKKGVMLTAGEMYRTQEQQAIYVSKGLSKTMNSLHCKRLAVDLNLFINGKYITDREPYKFLSDYWKTLNPKNNSGYDWGWDANHFERSI